MAENQRKTVKVWRASINSPAGMMVTEKAAFLIGNRSNFVVANDIGTLISGKSITLNTTSEQIRVGGFFVKMNDLTQMIPSTLVTPMPNQVPFPPLGLALGILKDIPFFLGMINSATGVV